MKRVTVCLFLIGAGTGSCGLIGQSTKINKESGTLTNTDTSLQRTEEQARLERTKLLTFSSDSSQMNYSVQIWPKGNFSFSTDSGFMGEAKHILMTGKMNISANNRQSLIVDRQNENKLVTNTAQNVKIKTVKQQLVKKAAQTYKWIIGIMIVAACAGFYFFGRRLF